MAGSSSSSQQFSFWNNDAQRFSSSAPTPSINPALLRPVTSSAAASAGTPSTSTASGNAGNAQDDAIHRPLTRNALPSYSQLNSSAMSANGEVPCPCRATLDAVNRLLVVCETRVAQQQEYLRVTLDNCTASAEKQKRMEDSINAWRDDFESRMDRFQTRFDVLERVMDGRMDEFRERVDDMQKTISESISSSTKPAMDKMEQLQERVDEFQKTISESIAGSMKSATDKMDSLSDGIFDVSKIMVQMFQRSEGLQARLGESVQMTRDEMHSDKEAMGEFQRVQTQQMELVRDDMESMREFLQYALAPEQVDDESCNRNAFPMDQDFPLDILSRHPLSKISGDLPLKPNSMPCSPSTKLSKLETSLESTGRVAKAEKMPPTPESPPRNPASGCPPEIVPDNHELPQTTPDLNVQPESQSALSNPPLCDQTPESETETNAPSHEPEVNKETDVSQLEAKTSQVPPPTDEHTSQKALTPDGLWYNDPPPESSVRFEQTSSTPQLSLNDIFTSSVETSNIRGEIRFDLRIDGPPSPLTSIDSSESENDEDEGDSDSSDDADETGGDNPFIPNGDNAFETAGAGPSTLSSGKRKLGESKGAEMHKCPYAYAGCKKSFECEGYISGHVQHCKFSRIDFTVTCTPTKSPQGMASSSSTSSDTPLRVKLRIPQKIVNNTSVQPQQKKRKLSLSPGGVSSDVKRRRGRPRKSGNLSQRETKTNPVGVQNRSLRSLSQVNGTQNVWPPVQHLDDSHDWTLIQCDR
ncbi:hypothetical protein SCHPADRAFT_368990 [Schizopora paradoxa]|uniref:Uncharacterized protein n=1 Tax=Schizopora paradoxa TaxID=27342 RepID=A0A0H2RN61_9AGAM|nr:hypothetical protein SCHPADRAFT_368990 [Schizopora paradoxa]